MISSIQYTAVLTCHPETCGQAVRGIEARLCWTAGGVLALTYRLEGDIGHLRIPLPHPPRRSDGLWRHTCFEAFIAVNEKPEYCEFNFSPSGEWAAYYFHRYRDGAPFPNEDLAPNIIARSADDRLDLDAIVHSHRLPMELQNRCLRLGLSAVIEEESGILSYWALKHPPGRPDFHHPDTFALKVEPAIVDIVNEARLEER